MYMRAKQSKALLRQAVPPASDLHVDFLSGCARSGTTLLFQLLSSSREIWSLYREEHGIYEWDIGLHPDYASDQGNVLTGDELTAERAAAIRAYLGTSFANPDWFWPTGVIDDAGRAKKLAFRLLSRISRHMRFTAGSERRAIDKNPKHVYRTEFLKAIFPQARFVFIVRDARSNIASLLEGWEKQRFQTYRIPLANGEYFQWSFELPPGWHAVLDRTLPEIAAFQWVSANQQVLDAVRRWSADCLIVRYEDLIRFPASELGRACEFLGIEMSPALRRLARTLPVVNCLTAPDANKWRIRQAALDSVQHVYAPMQAKLGYPS